MDVALTPIAVQPNLLNPPAKTDAAELAKRGKIRETAQNFESSFLSIMIQQMFEGVKTSAPFGGGPGEDMFKSFMAEAMAKQMTRAGGVGLTDTVNREMLKLQGLK
ncbi:rod-binding protein [Phenylobacterium deserti]|uniref:Chemotaxis protein chel n=1 Tax=Phenylobacterium deserti TaxID=1914756 RepID=A0A328ACG9_9CAUL|nr:rod-binding protein [Phenylobacterium deserti]RAK52340.1 chemotaxis protein chel [Phenylobacterium deserti]